MRKNSLIYSTLVKFIFIRLPSFLFLPIIEILYHIHRSRSLKNKKIDKRNGTLELVESIVLKYNKSLMIKDRKMQKLLNFQGNYNKRLKFSILNDELQLYLLRNLLYRILNKCIPQSKIRKLVKIEILKAPEGTFSDFVYLCDDLTRELSFVP